MCEDQTLEHTSLYEHSGRGVIPLCGKKGCKGGDKADHPTPHRHSCPHGRNCSFLTHSVADKRVIRHTAAFLHPCPWGPRCVAARAPEWNWEHMQAFTHTDPLKVRLHQSLELFWRSIMVLCLCCMFRRQMVKISKMVMTLLNSRGNWEKGKRMIQVISPYQMLKRQRYVSRMMKKKKKRRRMMTMTATAS